MNQSQKAWRAYNAEKIVKNVKEVLTSGDINKLRRSTYDFLYLMSGFIAHYNHGGFMDYYNDTRDLLRDLKASSDLARPDYWLEDFFTSRPEQRAYYESKAKTCRLLADLINN
jgi:hypothetical protein